MVQCDGGKHGGGCLGGGRHGKHGGGALNIIVGVPTPVPTPVPVPTYTPMATVGRVHYEPQVYQGKQQVQVPVTTKQQFQGQGQRIPNAPALPVSVPFCAALCADLRRMCPVRPRSAYVPQTAKGAYGGF